MKKFKVILVAEDGEYVQAEFNSFSAAEKYCIENEYRHGDDQQLVID